MSGLSDHLYQQPAFDHDSSMSAIIKRPTKVIVKPARRKVGDEIEHKPRHATDDEIKDHYQDIQTRNED